MVKRELRVYITFGIIIGIIGAVYLFFGYVMPLIIPFVLAFFIAMFISSISGRICSIIFKDSEHGRGYVKAILLILFLLIISTGIYFICTKLVSELVALCNMLPKYMDNVSEYIDRVSGNIEQRFHIRDGFVSEYVNDNILKYTWNLAGSSLMKYSGNMVSMVGKVLFTTFIFITALVLILKDERRVKSVITGFINRDKIHMWKSKLFGTVYVYIKIEAAIIMFTCLVCVVGYYIIGNRYSVTAGILTGLFDALPLFGLGMVLIPYAVYEIFAKDYISAVILVIIYIICNFMRQIMEANMIGRNIGITSVEMLMSMYVGIRLYGLSGFIYGPFAYIMIKKMSLFAIGKMYD